MHDVAHDIAEAEADMAMNCSDTTTASTTAAASPPQSQSAAALPSAKPADEMHTKTPQPLPAAAQQAINPLHHLLFAFPVPQLLLPTSLAETGDNSGTDSSQPESVGTIGGQTGATRRRVLQHVPLSQTRQPADALLVQQLASGMQRAVRALLSDDRLTHLVQEMCHRDAAVRRSVGRAAKRGDMATTSTPAPAATSSDAGAECVCASSAMGDAPCAQLSTDAALALLDRRVTGTLRAGLSAAMQRRSAMAQGEAATEHNSPSAWELNTSCHVQLRRRSRADDTANEDAQASTRDSCNNNNNSSSKNNFIYEASPTSCAPKRPRCEMHAAMTSHRATMAQDEDGCALLAQLLARPERVTSEALESVIAVAPLRPRLLHGAAVDQLAHALNVLASRATRPAVAGEAVHAAWHRSVCGLACCACLAHPSLSAAAVTSELVARLVTGFAQTVHCLAQRLVVSSRTAAQEGQKEGDAASDELRWLEQVRSFLRCWPPIICAEPVSLVDQNELIRLEDLALRCLFVLPHGLARAGFVRYASYIHDSALHMYRCVWNHLVTQRDELAARFFGRVPVSELLLLRTGSCGVDCGSVTVTRSDDVDDDGDGKDTTNPARCMPLTLALLSAAQSMPLELLLPRTTDRTTDCAAVLRRQCTHWAEYVLTQLVLAGDDTPGRSGERAERDVRHAAAVRLFAELAALVGMPQWPAAAWLLRGGLQVIADAGFAGTSVAGALDALGPQGGCARQLLVQAGHTESARESLRLLALDCVSSVALRLFDPATATALPPCVRASLPVGHPLSTRQGEAGGGGGLPSEPRHALAQYLRQAVPIDAVLLRTWQRSWCDDDGADSAAEAESDALCGLSPQSALHAAVYFALSRHAETCQAADVGSTWRHARLVHLLCWGDSDAARATTQLIRAGSAVTTLAQSRASPAAGLALPAATLRTCCMLLHTAPPLLLSEATWRAMVGALLAVFYLRDRHGAVAAVSEVVTRRALQHLTQLTLLYPPLHRLIWPLAQRLLREGGARVREGAVSLLLVVLSGGGATAGPAATGTPAANELVTDIVTTLLHLLSDRSAAVVSRVVAALEALLTDERYAALLRGAQGLSLSTYIQYKLLALLCPTAGAMDGTPTEQQQLRQQRLRHKAEVARLFTRRWVRMGQQYAEMELGGDGVVPSSTADGSSGGGLGDTAALLARELAALVTLCSPDFPYEVSEHHALVLLMRDVLCGNSKGATGRKAKAGAASYAQLQHLMRATVRALWSRYQCCVSPGDAVACLAVLHVMARVEGRWLEPLLEVLLRCLDCPPDPASPLHASRELMGGVVLQTCYILRSVLAGAGASATAASSYRVPAVSLEQLARAFTALISRYVGLYQQRVIVAACGALTSMITCGAKSRLSARVNATYLRLCYSLMNTYYVRVRALLPELAAQPQNVAYTQRFLFLLSEFLRLYPGWRRIPAALLLSSASSGQDGEEGGGALSSAPGIGVLASEPGLCENCFQLVVDVLAACDDGDAGRRSRLFVITLRVLASLCMQDPTVYLYRSEGYLHEALASDAELAWQVQGLTLIRDFLREEDARVELAARVTTRVCPDTPSGLRRLRDSAASADADRSVGPRTLPRDTAYTTAAHDTTQPGSCMAGGDGLVDAAAATADLDSVAEQNSGMSTWLMQHFYERVRELCGSAQPALRLLCLDILELTAQGGLLPPTMYLDALIALSADVDGTIRPRAAACLTTHVDLHETAIAAAAARGVLLAYDLHHACGADLVRSGLAPSPRPSEGSCLYEASNMFDSVHDVWFSALHKRARQQTLSSLLRYFTDESRALTWYRSYGMPASTHAASQPPRLSVTGDATVVAATDINTTTGTATTSASVSPDFAVGALLTAPAAALCTRTPATFLAHLAAVLACCRYRSESDVEHVLQQCRRGIDLHGQTAYEYVVGLCNTASATAECVAPLAKSPPRAPCPQRQRRGRRGAAAANTTAQRATAEVAQGQRWLVLEPLLLWRAFATLMLHHISRTLRIDVPHHGGAVVRRGGADSGARGAAALPGTTDRSAVLATLCAVVSHTAMLARCLTGPHEGVAVVAAEAYALRVPCGAVLDELRYLSEQLRLVLEAEEATACESAAITGDAADDEVPLVRTRTLHGGKSTCKAARRTTTKRTSRSKAGGRRATRRRAREDNSRSSSTASSEECATSVSRGQSSETNSDATASDRGISVVQPASEAVSDV